MTILAAMTVAITAATPARALTFNDLLSKDGNPAILFLHNMNEACPVNVAGLASDAKEGLGEIWDLFARREPARVAPATPSVMSPWRGATQGETGLEQRLRDHFANREAEKRTRQKQAKGLSVKRLLGRFCLYNKLFGDAGQCSR